MKLGMIGLGKMGSQLTARLIEAGHEVVATDHEQKNIASAAEAGAATVSNRDELVQKLGSPAIVWLMIPAQFVKQEIEALLKLLPRDSIIIDGGNSDFRDTKLHAETCQKAGVELVDVGTSGGVQGGQKGFSMMIGGDDAAFKTIEPAIKALAQPDGYHHFGPSGAGHYVKMIHNGIEYGLMQAYAEGYRLLKEGQDYPELDLAAAASTWQNGSIIASSLNEDARQALNKDHQLEGVDGYVHESGEARWTLETAKQQNIELPVIQAALDVRLASQEGQINFGTKLLAAMRNVFGGHELNK